MPKETVETADNISDEDKAWMAEEDRKMKETEKKIASGEISEASMAGWDSENWQTKASAGAPDDVDI